MNNLIFQGAVCTDRGNYRKKNEDNFSLGGHSLPREALSGRYTSHTEAEGSILCGVFDGVGGEMNGEYASAIGATLLPRYEASIQKRGAHGIHSYISAANLDICDLINQCGHSMGTTAALLVASEEGVTAYNIGDSRVYLWRDGKLLQLSKDHIATDLLIENGTLTPQEAATDPRRHHLTQCIGTSPEEMEIQAFESITLLPKAGDRYLLCSDGVCDPLPGHIIARILGQNLSSDAMAETLVATAMDYGSRDNCTALVVQVASSGPSAPRKTASSSQEESRRGIALLVILYLLSCLFTGMIANLLLHFFHIL